MDFIARKFVFVPEVKILPDEWIAELDQIYRYLSGVLAGQFHLKQLTVNSTIILQNTLAGKDIILFKQNGLDKVRVLETQQLKSDQIVNAPLDVVSTTVVTKLNAQYLDGLVSNNFITINTRHTEFFVPLLLDPANTITTKNFVYIVPAGTNMTIIKIDAYPVGFAGDSSGQITISVRKNGVAQLSGSITPGSTLTTGPVSIALVENDIISMTIDSVDTVPYLDKVFARVKVKQDLNS